MWGQFGLWRPGRHPPKISMSLLLVTLQLQGQALIAPVTRLSQNIDLLLAKFLFSVKGLPPDVYPPNGITWPIFHPRRRNEPTVHQNRLAKSDKGRTTKDKIPAKIPSSSVLRLSSAKIWDRKPSDEDLH